MNKEQSERTDSTALDREGALDRGESSSDYAKQWTNRVERNTTLPASDFDVKNEWVGLTVYLPQRLRDELELVYRERSYECKRTADVDLKKLQHFYPLVVALGLERLEDTSSEDFVPLLSYLTSEYD